MQLACTLAGGHMPQQRSSCDTAGELAHTFTCSPTLVWVHTQPACLTLSPLTCEQATYLRVANYSLFALFGLAAINEAAIFFVGLRGEPLLCCSPAARQLLANRTV